MVATLYTTIPVAFKTVGNSLHELQQVLGSNLRAVLEKRKLSVRGATPEGMSNRTLQNMVNAKGGFPQLDSMMAVSIHLKIPLWQLLCPAIDASRFGDKEVHQLVEGFCSLSEIRRARFLQNLEDAVTSESVRHAAAGKNSA